jgi:hypothetical protein
MPSVHSKLFDHKAILLNFNSTKPAVTTIPQKIVSDPDLPILVEIAVVEINTRYSAIPSAKQRQVSLGILGRCRRLLCEAGPDPVFASSGGNYVKNNFNLDQIQNGELLLLRIFWKF